MPASAELVANKSLSGDELSRIILADTATLLANHGLLCSQMAFRRISYEVRLTLHLDLPSLPLAVETARSGRTPALCHEAISTALPLPDASDAATFTSDELHRVIASPNAARLEQGLPITVSTRDQDGHQTERKVQYPAAYPGVEMVPPTTTDVTDRTRAELGMPPDATDTAAPAAPAERMTSDDLRT